MEILLEKINRCVTMEELDSLRLEIVMVGKGNKEAFETLQKAFTKKKNQLKRN